MADEGGEDEDGEEDETGAEPATTRRYGNVGVPQAIHHMVWLSSDCLPLMIVCCRSEAPTVFTAYVEGISYEATEEDVQAFFQDKVLIGPAGHQLLAADDGLSHSSLWCAAGVWQGSGCADAAVPGLQQTSRVCASGLQEGRGA